MASYCVIPAASAPVSLEQAKAHLRVTHAEDDDLIQALIYAATDLIEQRTNCQMVQATWAEVLPAFPSRGDYRIILPRVPLVAVTSIEYWDEHGVERTLPPSCYNVSTGEKPGWVQIRETEALDWPATQERRDAVTILYTAGW
jgi:uncharacterized phiE125 gp8 family phage protein